MSAARSTLSLARRSALLAHVNSTSSSIVNTAIPAATPSVTQSRASSSQPSLSSISSSIFLRSSLATAKRAEPKMELKDEKDASSAAAEEHYLRAVMKKQDMARQILETEAESGAEAEKRKNTLVDSNDPAAW